MATTKLKYLGRLLILEPAALGKLFESHMTITRIVQIPASADNGWKRSRGAAPEYAFWYDTDKSGKEIFCCFGGYLAYVQKELTRRNIDFDLEMARDSGLPEPDLDVVRGINWRPRQLDVLTNILAFQGGIIKCSTAFGKCLGRGTPVLMFDGTVKPVEQVIEGDQLMGPDSKPRNVLTTCTGVENLYKVKQLRGDDYVVNESHILSLKMTTWSSRGKLKGGNTVELSVKDYLATNKTFKHQAKGWKAAVDFPPAPGDKRLPAYILGVWLGDGSSHQFDITTMDPEIDAEVHAFAKHNNLHVSYTRGLHPDGTPSKARTLHVIARPGGNIQPNECPWVPRRLLRDMGLYKNKHVPMQYKTATRQERLELLAGIMDTDGYYNKGGVYELVMVSERLIDDVIFIARSLGFCASKKPKRKECCNNGVWGDYWQCIIGGSLDEIPCRVKHKQAPSRVRQKNPLLCGISVEPLGPGDYYGFTLDGDHRFLLGDFTVTHNTFCIKQLCRIYHTAKIVIVVGSLDIARSIYDDLRQTMPKVGFCGTGGQHPDRVTVCVAKSMHNAPANASLVLADECHTMATESVIKDLNRFHQAKLFGFSASPEGRSDGADGYMEAVFGPQLVDVTYQEAVSSGNVVQLEAYIVPVTTGPNVDGSEDDQYINRAGIIRNTYRNNLVMESAKWLDATYGPDAQGLIMVDKTEHAFMLKQLLPDFTVVHGTVTPERAEELREIGALMPDHVLCTAKDRDVHRKAFESNTLKRVIATRIWEKGVDFRDLAWLVRADGLASTIAACQIPGRLSRLGKETDKQKGVLVDFNDVFARCLGNRSKRRIAFYKDSGWVMHVKTFS